MVRLRGTWSEGSRGEEGCLAASGDLGQLFPGTLATEALWSQYFVALKVSLSTSDSREFLAITVLEKAGALKWVIRGPAQKVCIYCW